MREDETLSLLIGDIYDAALDSGLWPSVLGRTRDFVRGQTATLFWKDAVSKEGAVFYHDGGVDEGHVERYFREYIKLDPTTTAQFFADVGQPFSTADLLPYDEFMETRFYREWACPQGQVDFVGAVLEKSATSFALYGVIRHQRDGVADEEARRRVGLIVPHIRRSVLVGKVIELKDAQAASLAEALDGLSAGMFLVDADGRIVHANASGHAMLAKGDVLHAAGGRLLPADPTAERIVHDGFLAAGKGDAAVGTRGIAIPLSAADGERYLAHMLPLTSGARRRAGAACAAVAALFVHRATLDGRSPLETIARQYRLTPMELRVLLAIVEIGGVPDVAEALGIGETTVKTHLGHLYEKTGSHRQADLVKLVAGYASPLIG
ncbi:MAG TPA: LuxR C-terminal-related transcriptional regulator [Afifellaceae bacterium]|nr:LuxR C-terminal-related transcriptional regulator [Afifellaceae bacterium]